jgi:putative ABC transport system permease protein
VSNLSRAYRVNLTVLALVALFTGAFLVFSVLALSVAQRGPQFALLAVLGATPRQRLALVLAESALLGVAGSLAGLALGTLLASAALQLLGGDLGGGYFAGVQPRCSGACPPPCCTAAWAWPPPWQAAGGPPAPRRPCRPRRPSKAWAVPAGAPNGAGLGMVLIAASAGGGASTHFWHSIGGLRGDWPAAGGRHCAAALGRGLAAAAPAAAGARHPLTLLALERARRMRGTPPLPWAAWWPA